MCSAFCKPVDHAPLEDIRMGMVATGTPHKGLTEGLWPWWYERRSSFLIERGV